MKAIMLLQVLLGFGFLPCSLTSNIVLLPMFSRSHYMVLAKLGEELANRGHKVTILVGDTEKGVLGEPNTLVFHVNDPAHTWIVSPLDPHRINIASLWSVLTQYCSDMLEDTKSLQEMEKADLIIGDNVCSTYEEIKNKYNITPHETITDVLTRVDLILVELDFPIEVPRPLLPNTKVVGPFTPGPAKPLSPELEEFMQSSGAAGVVLVSFGTIWLTLDRHVQKLATVFSKLPQKIIWKIKPERIKFPLSKNVKVMSWIPQNDIAGHSKVKLLLGHGGINSLFESIYHGLPQVVAPLAADQHSNARMAKHHGIAEHVDIDSITADELVQVMRTVMMEASYRDNAARLSRFITLKPRPPVSEAADWVEYLLAVGSLSHLRPRELDLPFYQLYLLDVLLAALVFLFVLLWLARCLLSLRSRSMPGTM